MLRRRGHVVAARINVGQARQRNNRSGDNEGKDYGGKPAHACAFSNNGCLPAKPSGSGVTRPGTILAGVFAPLLSATPQHAMSRSATKRTGLRSESTTGNSPQSWLHHQLRSVVDRSIESAACRIVAHGFSYLDVILL